MIEVYSNLDSGLVGFYRTLLEEEGIATFYRNEFVSGVEVVVPVFYPAICVVNPEDEMRARDIIRNAAAPASTAGADWTCTQCNETVPGNFSECWNCAATAAE
jgi:hypothetical protein